MANNINWKKESAFTGPQRSPGYLLWRVSTDWRRRIENDLRAHAITHVQFVLLASIGWLSQKQALVSQIDIARHGSLDVNMTSQVIRALEARGLIRREHIAGNKRSKYCSLTAQGTRLLRKVLPIVEAVDQTFFAQLAEQQEMFCTLMVTLLEQKEEL